mmetsp:Transcript_11132/g.18061  ORF Transcript_11132/g.18061 Transcript_11132/m.18061 type:complete len:317 (+) Transcript_11132:188-1138(+)
MAASALEESDDREDMTAPVHQKFNPMLHGGFAAGAGRRDQLLHPEFIRKYIHYAKSRIKPVLTAEASEFINQEYATLRQEQETKTLPVTARQLESFIRLSTAHAKARLSNEVEVSDAEEALRTMRYALYHDTMPSANTQAQDTQPGNENPAPTNRTRLRRGGGDSLESDVSSDEGSDDLDGDDGQDGRGGGTPGTRSDRRSRKGTPSQTRRKRARLDQHSSAADQRSTAAEQDPDEEIVDESSIRFMTVRTVVMDYARNKRTECFAAEAVRELATEKLRESDRHAKAYSEKEFDGILERLEARNRIMYRDGEITII